MQTGMKAANVIQSLDGATGRSFGAKAPALTGRRGPAERNPVSFRRFVQKADSLKLATLPPACNLSSHSYQNFKNVIFRGAWLRDASNSAAQTVTAAGSFSSSCAKVSLIASVYYDR